MYVSVGGLPAESYKDSIGTFAKGISASHTKAEARIADDAKTVKKFQDSIEEVTQIIGIIQDAIKLATAIL
jgi:hypothetical protein